MFWVTCAEVDEIPRTVLMIAIGSPLTNALGIAGSVGSHCAVPLLARLGGRCTAHGPSPRRGLRRLPCGGAGGVTDADALFTWAS